jgi:hypothetical protein
MIHTGRLPRESLVILASVISGDNHIECDFDAVDWFEQATDEEILDVDRTAWSDSYPTDAVARYCEDQPAVAKVFEYLEKHAERGEEATYACWISQLDAMTWLWENRPYLARRLKLKNEERRAVSAKRLVTSVGRTEVAERGLVAGIAQKP